MKKPNLIYIFADQLRFNSVGYNGDTNAETPNIDAFCKESTNLCQAYPDILYARPTGPPCLQENTRRAPEWSSMRSG